MGKADKKLLMAFCDEHLRHFTPEGLRYALEKQPNAVRKQYAAHLKQLKGNTTLKQPPQPQPQPATEPASKAVKKRASKRKRAQTTDDA